VVFRLVRSHRRDFGLQLFDGRRITLIGGLLEDLGQDCSGDGDGDD